jgi:hypothetical protein
VQQVGVLMWRLQSSMFFYDAVHAVHALMVSSVPCAARVACSGGLAEHVLMLTWQHVSVSHITSYVQALSFTRGLYHWCCFKQAS